MIVNEIAGEYCASYSEVMWKWTKRIMLHEERQGKKHGDF